jgi:hypothetical protein
MRAALWLGLPLLGLGALEWLLTFAGPGLPWWHSTPGFQAAYGVVGCIAIVIVAKGLGKAWLQRPERDDA